MVLFSTLRSFCGITARNEIIKRFMSEHRIFPLQASRYAYVKFKDQLHFYFMLGIIPCSLVVLYTNLFIGPAQLTEIPEGYEPKQWEYYRHPISRFICRYLHDSHQQDYEKNLAFMFMEEEASRIRRLEKEIKKKMAERNDYQAYYYRPVIAKYHRLEKEEAEKYISTR